MHIFDFTVANEKMEIMRGLDTDTSYFTEIISNRSEEKYTAMYLNQPQLDDDLQK